jgi:hypothetical protein
VGLNGLVRRNIRTVEMTGVLMRIFSFSLVSWLGPRSPFLFIWAFNTCDAIMLSWSSVMDRRWIGWHIPRRRASLTPVAARSLSALSP